MFNYLPETIFYFRLLPRLNIHAFLLDDKCVFAAAVASLGVSIPRTVIVFRRGTIMDACGSVLTESAQIDALLGAMKGDIVLKPATGSGGKEIYVFRRSQSGRYQCGDNSLDHQFLSRLDGCDWLVQEYVEQCEELSLLHSNSLNTLRVVTIFNPGVGARVLYCMLKVGANHAITDNAHTGGVYVRVQMDDGRLDDVAYDEELRSHHQHPTTGVSFSGIRIRQIHEVLRVACLCANAFPALGIVGWDIACTPSGPIVIEGNSSPGLTIIQRTYVGMVDTFMPSVEKLLRRNTEGIDLP